MSENTIEVSIVIPTLNSEAYLVECLQAIFQNSFPRARFEVIAVDNGSTDGTLSILHRFGVCILTDANANVSGLRNMGAARATGTYVAFIDSDCIVDRDWIASAVQAFGESGPDVGAIGHPYLLPPNPMWIERAWESTINRSNRQPSFLSAGNLVMKRELFLAIGGFNNKLITGEDYELCQRIRANGYRVVSDGRLKSVHMGNAKTLLQVFRREVWYGKGMLGTLRYELSKPMLLAVLYLLLSLLMAGGAFDFIINRRLTLLAASAIPFFTIPVGVAFLKSFRSRSIKRFLQLIPIYFAYILGRMVSLFYIRQILTNLYGAKLQEHTS